MAGDDVGNLVYLIILGCAVLFWFVTNHRQSFGKSIQQGLAWFLIFVGVIAAYGMWGDIRSTVVPTATVHSETGTIEVPRNPDGHYRLTVEVNGAPIVFVVDTGASDIVLSKSDATKAGLDLETLAYIGRAQTANGQVRTAPVILDELRLGAYVDTRVGASVNGGDLDQSLLGMSYLQRYREITISAGKLLLVR
ncbi:aspartyl protease family protein [Shimia gijangensis]|uniref:Aspartyl protease family protein n=2 Tax=Shimia gijangensis TaxID=1470563 RepID=A0A1M6HCW3_9RHOB|nr:aspartyl protease family protein [Shimia gijangensis]